MQFVESPDLSRHWKTVKPLFVESAEAAAIALGSSAELLDELTFSKYVIGYGTRSVHIELKTNYFFDGKTELPALPSTFTVTGPMRTFGAHLTRAIVGKTVFAANEVANAHLRTGRNISDMITMMPGNGSKITQRFSCQSCANIMRLFGNIFVCHKCGATKSALC